MNEKMKKKKVAYYLTVSIVFSVYEQNFTAQKLKN